MPGYRSGAEWLELADKVRAIADEMRDPISKRQMLAIATDYEALAGHAEFLDAAKRLLAPHDDTDWG